MLSAMALLALTRMTAVDAARQPVTWLMTGISAVLLMLSFLFGMFNFEAEDRMRMLATAGVAVGLLNGLFLGVVLASQSIHDELASRTALTLFAKPLGRGSFLMGKALGVWLVVAASIVLLAGLHFSFLAWGQSIGFEDALDNHDHGGGAANQGEELVAVPWAAILLAHLLGLGHTAILATMAVVLALRFGLVTNILVCFAMFVAGHLLAGFKTMGFLVIPALAAFNIDDVIQLPGQAVSWSYLLIAGLYTVCFCAGCLLLGLAAFRRQDIP